MTATVYISLIAGIIGSALAVIMAASKLLNNYRKRTIQEAEQAQQIADLLRRVAALERQQNGGNHPDRRP